MYNLDNIRLVKQAKTYSEKELLSLLNFGMSYVALCNKFDYSCLKDLDKYFEKHMLFVKNYRMLPIYEMKATQLEIEMFISCGKLHSQAYKKYYNEVTDLSTKLGHALTIDFAISNELSYDTSPISSYYNSGIYYKSNTNNMYADEKYNVYATFNLTITGKCILEAVGEQSKKLLMKFIDKAKSNRWL